MIVRPTCARAVVAGVSSLALAAGLSLVAVGPAGAITTDWHWGTPGHYTWTVPAGVHLVDSALWGASGGGSAPNRGDGGAGAFVTAGIEVTPGDTLDIYVGGAGTDRSDVSKVYAGGFNGGGDGADLGVNSSGAGGGGASDIRYGGTALVDRVVVAAGGGGTSSTPGGSASGENGESGGAYGLVAGGGGATTLAGGVGATGLGGTAGSAKADDGVLGRGGDGLFDANCRNTGGGGGGGLYGGGGGACQDNAGASGGGAGSSLVPAGGTIEVSGGSPNEDLNGYVSLSLVVPDAPSSAPTAVAGNGQATISWPASTFPGSMAISGYTVASSPDGRTCATNGALSCVVTGLTNGTAYTFTVVANSAVGNSDPTAASDPVTPFGSSVVAPIVSFPTRAGFLTSSSVMRSWGSPTATMTSGTPSVCRVVGASVVFLRVTGTCRVAVSQDGTVVARGVIPVTSSGPGKSMTAGSIAFRAGSSYLSPAAKAWLVAKTAQLRGNIVVVTGWVSGMRTTPADRVLSAQRAKVIAAYLGSLGVQVTARYGAGSRWLGSSAASRAAQVSWFAVPHLT
jgi:hypothetical protein